MNDSSKDGRSPHRRGAWRRAWSPPGAIRNAYHGFVNPPVYHASTVLYPNAEDFLAHRCALPIRPPRHADHGSAGIGAAGDRRAALRRRRRCCRRGSLRFRPRYCRCCRPATICWSPTAPIGPTRNFCGRHPQAARHHHHLLRSADRQPPSPSNCSSRTPARSLSSRRARSASKCRTSRRSPRSRMTKARSC